MTDANKVREYDRGKRILIYAGVLLVVFLLGLVPMGFKAYLLAVERNQARHDLRLCTIQAALASATIDARLGNYEPARQAASNFFTELRTELDKENDGVFDRTQRESLKPLLVPRDDLVTLLARSDPAAADRLGSMFTTYHKAVAPQH